MCGIYDLIIQYQAREFASYINCVDNLNVLGIINNCLWQFVIAPYLQKHQSADGVEITNYTWHIFEPCNFFF